MERLGFIGLGIMGKPMALNLLKAGYSLVVLSRGMGPQNELVAAGATAGASPEDVACQSDVVITMLPDSPDVEQVVLGRDGVLQGLQSGGLVIDMSTVLPSLARRIADVAQQKGCEALDAPVSGGQIGAENGTLSIMVGGPLAAFERAKPIFEKMGQNIVYIGEAGAGQVTKAANQIVCAATIATVGEALVFAKKAGVDPAKVREALLGGFAQSRILDLYGPRMMQHNFQPGFKMKLHRKDMAIVLNTARELGVSAPVSAIVTELMNAVIASVGGELDNSALVTVFEKLANVEV
jgi:2-hydroxy-3-oxopropionate reductase